MEKALNLDWNLNYGELASDHEFVGNVEELKANLIEIQKILENVLPLKEHYNSMPLASQIELDLFLTFTLNSLLWIQLKVNGVDTSTHPLKIEFIRIRNVMQKWQEFKDKDKRPTVNIAAARRFIKSGLYDSYKGTASPDSGEQHANKRRKFK